MAVLFSQIFDRLSVDLVFFIVPAFFPVFGVHHSTQSYQGSLIKAAVFTAPVISWTGKFRLQPGCNLGELF
jgi:hypothetical protein